MVHSVVRNEWFVRDLETGVGLIDGMTHELSAFTVRAWS